MTRPRPMIAGAFAQSWPLICPRLSAPADARSHSATSTPSAITVWLAVQPAGPSKTTRSSDRRHSSRTTIA
jgi:hypothetical protein